MQPRVIRLKDAPSYLGMDKNTFNEVVRHQLHEFPIGREGKGRGIGFDRLDLDAWLDEHKRRNGCAPRREKTWQENERQGCISEMAYGKLKKLSSVDAFAKALEAATSKKQKSI